jgi:hypothetical protein
MAGVKAVNSRSLNVKIENCKTNWVKSFKLKVLVTRLVMSLDRNLAVLTANQADRARKTTVSLIVSGCFALRSRGLTNLMRAEVLAVRQCTSAVPTVWAKRSSKDRAQAWKEHSRRDLFE